MALTVTLNGDDSIDVEQPVPKDYQKEPATETFENEAALDVEIAAQEYAIDDIENFKQRRLDNLNSRLDYCNEIKNAI